MSTMVLDWNGRDVPPELQALPPGRYVIEPAVDFEAMPMPAADIAAVEEALVGRHLAKDIPGPVAREQLRRAIEGHAAR